MCFNIGRDLYIRSLKKEKVKKSWAKQVNLGDKRYKKGAMDNKALNNLVFILIGLCLCCVCHHASPVSIDEFTTVPGRNRKKSKRNCQGK